mmetsp:Transcript_15813/g.38260  ORF Transcript_15813/g.38260 Transcript_15813/m.38260 type:complete len:209 (+) Transcript_15813:355-981(+)
MLRMPSRCQSSQHPHPCAHHQRHIHRHRQPTTREAVSPAAGEGHTQRLAHPGCEWVNPCTTVAAMSDLDSQCHGHHHCQTQQHGNPPRHVAPENHRRGWAGKLGGPAIQKQAPPAHGRAPSAQAQAGLAGRASEVLWVGSAARGQAPARGLHHSSGLGRQASSARNLVRELGFHHLRADRNIPSDPPFSDGNDLEAGTCLEASRRCAQ